MSEELRQIRIEKLNRLREIGMDPYATEKFEFERGAADLINEFEEGKSVCFAGRIVSHRLMGKAGFAHLSDGDAKIQGYFKKDDLGETAWEAYNLLDLGDHLGIEGELFITKTGEKSIHVRKLTPLSKALQVLPFAKEKDGERYNELHDVELRYRHRHLDLICNPEARELLINRMKMVSAVRRFFDSHGYLEAETPQLQLVAGGAAATPFLTRYNAYDLEVKLRISLELPLKRIICGDVPRVYEIGRVFRNEGVSNRHSPEFTLLEFYEAFTNLEGMMERVEALFKTVMLSVYGKTSIELDGVLLEFGQPWKRVHMLEEIGRHTGLTPEDLSDLERAKSAMQSRQVSNPQTGKHIDLSEEKTLGGLIEKLLEVFVEPTLQEPTFVIGYPIETSPLAKKEPGNPKMTRRFEGYIRGREICNAFSEINDPQDQRERFENQIAQLAEGNEEAHPMDEDFIFALECGMPPTGGCGIGMDRMAMLLSPAESIREVLIFPMMKPE